ncbi:heparinase [Sphingomonas sp. Leaf412]|uniref:heparinase II/III family protein n=1 Tax=Sphingomonas sp. Leaf412 TaxID=1736370 RepID=UPI0006F6F813|nr:heparinase II/III family protein [Sphingomonas sp. Leaf412]KQT34950.1 heparinase [Sphingomonas sp. Leaf412]
MSDGPAGGDGIESGRRLVRADPAAAQSLSQKLAHYLERLTWRTPLHDMRLKGRHPLRLLAVPVDPMPGDADAGLALLDGRLVAGGEAHDAATVDLSSAKPGAAFLDYLHGFVWLRDLAATRDRDRAVPVAEALTARWLDAHADKVRDPVWRPEVAGRRLAMWAAYAPLILSSGDIVFRSKVLNAIARTARHLDRAADKAGPGPERLAAWCGVVTAGLLLPGGDARVAFGEAGLARALAAAVGEDGGIASRSPVALAEGIAVLALLRAAYEARRRDLPEDVAATLTRMGAALAGVTMSNGALSSWQGGAATGAAQVADVFAAAGLHPRPLRQAKGWGYQRLTGGRAVVVVDAAPPPLATAADGGCASTLAFEYSEGPDRLIVNCGGARAAAAKVAPATARGLRSTAAHSTLVVADSNSTALHPDGSLGKGVGSVDVARQESDVASRIDAGHDGYARRFGFLHRRQLILTADGRELRGEDALLPAGRARRAERATPFALRFHLGPGVEAARTADGQAAILRTPSGAIWQFRTRAETLEVEESVWVDAAGRFVPTQQIVVGGSAAAGGASVAWALRRAR